jgi:hypothetical protein
MKIFKKQIICEAGDFENEDAAGINEYGAWLLDGATGLSGTVLTNEKSDARWYTKWWGNYLSNSLKKNLPLTEIIANGICHISAEFDKAIKHKPCSKLDYPSSSIIVLKWHERHIEYFSLGDSPIIIQIKDDIKEITDKKVLALDKKVFNAMNKVIQKNNISAWEAKTMIMPMIKENRMMYNTERGYWILGFDTSAVGKAAQGIIKVTEPTKILMASDGFSALVDKYHAIDKEDFISWVEEKGLCKLYDYLRTVENDDNFGIKFPRYKKSDDASAIFFEASE